MVAESVTLTPTLSQREREPFGVDGKFGLNLGASLLANRSCRLTAWPPVLPNGPLSRLRGRVREGVRSSGQALE